LLASKPEDLRDGEVICELAAMLLGPQSVPQPGDRVGTGVSDEYADAERLELALEALAKHADLVAEIKSREEATLIALQAFEGAAAPSKM